MLLPCRAVDEPPVRARESYQVSVRMRRERTHRNPVYDEYFADPFVFRHDKEYFAVGTAPPRSGASEVLPLLRSEDLFSWRALGHALVRPDPALGDTYWAPEIAAHEGNFYLYYSVGWADREHQLRVAISPRPDGPYVDSGVALTDRGRCPFAIDPHPFRDDDGRWYLFYARDFLDAEPTENGPRRVRPGTAIVVQELRGMTELGERTTIVLRARHEWQRFEQNRPIHGGVYDWHTLEGPVVQKREGRYYCFYSGGRWDSPNYGVDYAVADDIWGPYTDDGADEGPRILRTVSGRVIGPGHNSFVARADGSTWIVYHAWDDEMRNRLMCVDPFDWEPPARR
jgi:beta-xylosidase